MGLCMGVTVRSARAVLPSVPVSGSGVLLGLKSRVCRILLLHVVLFSLISSLSFCVLISSFRVLWLLALPSSSVLVLVGTAIAGLAVCE